MLRQQQRFTGLRRLFCRRKLDNDEFQETSGVVYVTKLSIAVPLSQKRGRSKWRIQGSARQSMIEGINGRLVMSQLILVFTELIVGLYGQ